LSTIVRGARIDFITNGEVALKLSEGGREDMLARRRRVNILVAIVIVMSVLTAGCRASPPPPPQAPPMTLTLYENTEWGFSVEYPRGWVWTEQALGQTFGVGFRDPERGLTVKIYVESRPKETTLADAVSESKRHLKFGPLLELISEADVTIDRETPAYEIVYSRSVGAKVEEFRHIMFVREKQSFAVEVGGEPAALEQWQQLLDSMLSSFKLLPTYTSVSPTSSPGGTYTDTRSGFSVSYPLGWFEVPTGRPGQVASFAYSEGAQPGISVSVVPVDEGMALDEYGLQVSRDLGHDWSNHELVSQGEIALRDGAPAYEIVFSGTTEGRTLKCKYVIVIRETEAFFVMGFTNPDRFEQDEATIDKIIYNFHLE